MKNDNIYFKDGYIKISNGGMYIFIIDDSHNEIIIDGDKEYVDSLINALKLFNKKYNKDLNDKEDYEKEKFNARLS